MLLGCQFEESLICNTASATGRFSTHDTQLQVRLSTKQFYHHRSRL
jgi:hypothetical protein